MLKCAGCGEEFEGKDYQRWSSNKGNNVYCGSVCKNALSSATAAKTNRKYASARMTSNNPMRKAEVRQSVSDTLKRIGHKPSVRGGNGTGLTTAEQMLSDATGLQPYIVNTHGGRSKGFPTHYKLDLADPQHMLAIEVDGNSHNLITRQAQDRKKESYLRSRGWTVLRFTNKQVLENTAYCVSIIKENSHGFATVPKRVLG